MSAAVRMRRWRQRQKAGGIKVYGVPLAAYPLIAALIQRNRLSETTAEDDEKVIAEIVRIVEAWVRGG